MDSPQHPIILLFDGDCNLCSASVRWIIARDRRGVVRFASLQSPASAAALRRAGIDAATAQHLGVGPDARDRGSVVLIEGNRVLLRSDAALAVLAHLGWPWSWLAWSRVLPRALRDGVYAFVARHRVRWFGRADKCMVPTAVARARFLSDDADT